MTISKTLKQFLVVAGLTAVGLLIMNAFFIPGAFAVEMIRPEENVVAGQTGGAGSIRSLVLTIVNFFLGFLGLLAVIMIIYGGFLYVSSAGSEEKIGSAKKILMYAVIGIVIIIISFALVNTLLRGVGMGSDVGV